MKFYKYMDIKNAVSALKNGIYAGKLNEFNDPYEYEGIKYVDDYRVCCGTRSAMKMLMWAHYVSHQGCCVEYEVPKDCELIKNVEYVEDYYERREMNRDELFENLYVKAKEWKYENEIRIVCDTMHLNDALWTVIDEKYFFKKASVKAVCLGLNTDLNSSDVQNLFLFIDGYNSSMPEGDRLIKVQKCILSHRNYSITLDKQFDYRRAMK